MTTRRSGISLTIADICLPLAATGCARKDDTQGGSTAAAGKTAKDAKVALVPGGPHPYFQPWKTAGDAAKTKLGVGDVTFNETAGWDQTKQIDVLKPLAATVTQNPVGQAEVATYDTERQAKSAELQKEFESTLLVCT